MLKESAETLRKVFDSIDKDHSGSIDRSEVATLAKELGQEVNPAEVETIFAKIDTNKDGKISFEEFLIWWRNGAPSKMEKLVYLQLKGNKLLKKAHAGLTRIGATLATKYEDVEESLVAVKCGEVTDAQTYLKLNAGLFSQDQSRREAILAEFALPGDTYSIVAAFETPQATVLHESLVEIWEIAKELLGGVAEEAARILEMVNIRFELKGDKVLAIIQPEKMALEMYEGTIQQMIQFVQSLNLAADLSARVDVQSTLKTVLEQDYKPYKLLTEGFVIEGRGSINKVLASKIRHTFIKKMASRVEKGGYLNADRKSMLSLAMVTSLKLVLNLTVPEVENIMNQVGDTMGMNPDDQIPSTNNLLDMAKGIAEGPVSEILDGIPAGETIKKVLKNVDHTQTDLYVLGARSYAHATLRLPGHKEILERVLP